MFTFKAEYHLMYKEGSFILFTVIYSPVPSQTIFLMNRFLVYLCNYTRFSQPFVELWYFQFWNIVRQVDKGNKGRKGMSVRMYIIFTYPTYRM